MGEAGSYPSPRRAPWPGFALAAEAAVQHLNERFGLDLWLVTHVVDDHQTVVASAGHWEALATPGTDFSWKASFCRSMVEQRGPTMALDVSLVPDYAAVATGVLARVRAYVGVPLEADGGELFGTLCAFAGTPQEEAPEHLLSTVGLVGQMLSTILAHEQVALARSHEAATAYALVERDHRTGLLNRRGWEAALVREDHRVDRYGSSAGILTGVIEHAERGDGNDDDPAADDVLARCAELLTSTARPGDVQARLGRDEFAVLAIECDARCLQAMQAKLRVVLRTAGVPVTIGVASRRVGEHLTDTSARAQAAMHADRRRRRGQRT
jgi:diguanylate cyclase (GGDEF)-like protein